MKKLVADRKIILIGYRPLRDLQRKERKEGQAGADQSDGKPILGPTTSTSLRSGRQANARFRTFEFIPAPFPYPRGG
jgi:hypothetical protein